MIDHLFATLGAPLFWLALGKIIWIDVLLSGDNALVIAMACRALPSKQRVAGIALGAGAAVGLRILFTGVISTVMLLPYLRLGGGLALMYVAVKLLAPQDEDGEIGAAGSLFSAIRMIVIADIVMSLDNMIAVAAAAGGNLLLLAMGLMISIPLIVTGAALIVGILNRFPILVVAGSGLLGWIAGETIASDQSVIDFLPPAGTDRVGTFMMAAMCCFLVISIGLSLRYFRPAREVA